MKEARYIDGEGKIITVYAKDISAKDYEKTYRGKIYCENSKCSAEVVHQEIQKGGIKRFFRTRTGSVHISNCSHAIDYENKRARVTKIGEKVNVSDAHISQSLKDAYKMYLKKLHPDQKTNDNEEKKVQSGKKRNRSSKTTGDIVGTRTIGTAEPTGGEEVEQLKEPYIYKREASEISSKDEKQYRIIHSLIDKMVLKENEASIYLVDVDGTKSEIYIGEPFRTNSPNEFKLMKYIMGYIQQLRNKNEELVFNGFTEITSVIEPIQAQLYRHNDFNINGKSFYQIFKLTNEMT